MVRLGALARVIRYRDATGLHRNYRFLGSWPAVFRVPQAHFRQVTRRFEYVLYFDSRDPACPTQVLKWIQHGFLPRQRTLVLGRFYWAPAVSIIRALDQADVQFALFDRFGDIDISASRAVFYPLNANSNPRLVKYRGPRHIFLGHGDSDKAASTNPLVRVYDHIFVSGQGAVDRLLEERILTRHDLGTGRVVRIGMPYLPEARQEAPRPDGSVLYAPTWEGADATQRYSSLEGGWGRLLVAQLLETLSRRVVFRAHPSTGRLERRYARYVREIVDSYARHPRFAVHRGGVAGSASRCGVLCDVSASLAQASWVITDVSSVMSAAFHHSRPFVCVVKGAENTERVGMPLAAAAAFRLRHGEPISMDHVAQLASHDACLAALELQESSVGGLLCRESYLEGVPRSRLLEAIWTRIGSR